MAVNDSNQIDFVSEDSVDHSAVLTISDHLDWSDSQNHQLILQAKFNSYLRFAESGELIEKFPKFIGKPIAFRVIFKYEPDQDGLVFLKKARKVIESAGFILDVQTGI